MEVILLERVEKLGAIGEIVTVKDGYARNFLIPSGVALRATAKNKEEFEARKAEIEAENEEKKSLATKLAEQLEGKFFVLIMQAGEDGRLFGSVTARNIAKLINIEEVVDSEISHKIIRTNASIKYLGVYAVKLILHPDVIVSVNINVARSSTEAVEAEQAFLRGDTVENKAGEDLQAEALVEEIAEDNAPDAEVASQEGDGEEAA